MSESTSFPLIMTSAGPTPNTPTTLLNGVTTYAANEAPGYTNTLPGSLIEDISSTAVGALYITDQARVDAVASVTPYGANAYVLAQLGQQFGIPQGTSSNTTVNVMFSGSAGYPIPAGFVVGDGQYQYSLNEGTVIASTGYSPQVTATAILSGTWAVPANTVTTVVTSVPIAYTVNVTNPQAGTPGASAETIEAYRARVLLAGQVASTGTPAYLKTLLYAITGVQQNLVSINQITGGWQIICGGGDVDLVAGAILEAVPDISTLQGSQLKVTGITAANPAVITTNLSAGFAVGGTFTLTGSSNSAYNVTYTVASISGTTITTATNSSSFGTFTGTANFSPNPRNITVSLFQNPNTYNITYVNPPAQVVTVSVVWNTTLTGFTAGTSVNQYAATAIQNYINGIYVGQPINLLEMTAVFQNAVSSIISAVNITTLTFAVTINGVTATPSAGTSIIYGDPEGYFTCSATGVTVTQ